MHTAFIRHFPKDRLPQFDVRRGDSIKIEASCCYGNRLLCALSDGSLQVYAVFQETYQSGAVPSSIKISYADGREKFVDRGRMPAITAMTALPEIDMMLSLCGGVVYQHRLSSIPKELKSAQTIPNLSKVLLLSLRRVSCGRYQLAAVSREQGLRHSVTVLEYRPGTAVVGDGLVPWGAAEDSSGSSRTFQPFKAQMKLPDQPRLVLWAADALVFGFKRSYSVLSLSTQTSNEPFETGKLQQPGGVLLPWLDEILLLYSDPQAIGVHLTSKCEPARTEGIPFKSFPSQLVPVAPFLLALHNASTSDASAAVIMIGARREGTQPVTVQNIELPHVDHMIYNEFPRSDGADLLKKPSGGGRDLEPPATPVVFATTTSTGIFVLEMVSLKDQFKEMFAGRDFKEALVLASLAEKVYDPIPTVLSNQAKVSLGVTHFMEGSEASLREAFSLWTQTAVDPRCVVSLYPGFLPKYVTDHWWSPAVESGAEFEGSLFVGVPVHTEEGRKQLALKALVPWLEEWRRAHQAELPPDPPGADPLEEDLTPVGQQRATVYTALVKARVALMDYTGDHDKEIATLLRQRNRCVVNECDVVLRKAALIEELIILYQYKGAHERALLLMQSVCTSGSGSHIPDMMIRYLRELNVGASAKPLTGSSRSLGELIEEFASWVLRRESPQKVLQIFIPHGIVTGDTQPQVPFAKAFQFLEKELPDDLDCRISFLTNVIQKGVTDTTVHDALVYQLRDRILKVYEAGQQGAPNAEADMCSEAQALERFLDSSRAHCNFDRLTPLILALCMKLGPAQPAAAAREGKLSPAVTALYGALAVVRRKLHEHPVSIDILVHILNQHDAAVALCRSAASRNVEVRGSNPYTPTLPCSNDADLSPSALFLHLAGTYMHPSKWSTLPGALPQLERGIAVLVEHNVHIDSLATLKLLSDAAADPAIGPRITVKLVRPWLEAAMSTTSLTAMSLLMQRGADESRYRAHAAEHTRSQARYFVLRPSHTCSKCNRVLGPAVITRSPHGAVSHLVRKPFLVADFRHTCIHCLCLFFCSRSECRFICQGCVQHVPAGSKAGRRGR